MSAERYTLLGLAGVRSPWFREVGRWSTAAAVLIMAGIGALMWVGFKAMWQDTEDNTRDKVAEIGE